jgi:hypothetical protein
MSHLVNFLKSIFVSPTEAVDNGYDLDDSPTGTLNRTSASRRNNRIENEILMIAPRFASNGGIYYDEKNKDWLMIPKYPLPERWEERWCKLMIIFPKTYPGTPPIGFYLNKKFKLKSGGQDNHFMGQAYHGAPDMVSHGWHWYCVTMNADSQGGWHPSGDYTKSDNLWTFLNMVRESLTNDF